MGRKNHNFIIIFTAIFIIPSIAMAVSAGAAGLADSVKGKILLQVEHKGEAWYVNPRTMQRHYLGRPADAFAVMRSEGLGITDNDLAKIPIGAAQMLTSQGGSIVDPQLVNRLKGFIVLQVQQNGEAWYVNPADGKRYFLGRPEDAFALMRSLGLGISNTDLNSIPITIKEGWEPFVSREAGIQFQYPDEIYRVEEKYFTGEKGKAYQISLFQKKDNPYHLPVMIFTGSTEVLEGYAGFLTYKGFSHEGTGFAVLYMSGYKGPITVADTIDLTVGPAVIVEDNTEPESSLTKQHLHAEKIIVNLSHPYYTGLLIERRRGPVEGVFGSTEQWYMDQPTFYSILDTLFPYISL